MSSHARFRGVVNAGERLKPWRQAVMLVFGAGGGQRKVKTQKMSSCACFWEWLMLEKGQNPEDEQTCSFSGLVAVKEWLKPWKQTGMVHFLGWWLSENVQNPENEHDCSFSGLVVVSRLVEKLCLCLVFQVREDVGHWGGSGSGGCLAILVMYNGSQPLCLAFWARKKCWLSRWRWWWWLLSVEMKVMVVWLWWYLHCVQLLTKSEMLFNFVKLLS